MCYIFEWLEIGGFMFLGLTDLHLVNRIRTGDQRVEWTWTCGGVGEICAGGWG